VHTQASAGSPPPQQSPADDGTAIITGGEAPELEADGQLARHATPTLPPPEAAGPSSPCGERQDLLAMQPIQAAGHGENHPHVENEPCNVNLLNPSPVAARIARRRRQPALAQPKLTRLQARAGKRKVHHVLYDRSDEDVAGSDDVPSDSNGYCSD
jgi:hypothetical protein